jgi:hypothetical protein
MAGIHARGVHGANRGKGWIAMMQAAFACLVIMLLTLAIANPPIDNRNGDGWTKCNPIGTPSNSTAPLRLCQMAWGGICQVQFNAVPKDFCG